MNEKTKTANATGSLYRINYQYVNNRHQLRAGTVVLEATSPTDAWDKADKLIPTYGLSNYKITNAKLF